MVVLSPVALCFILSVFWYAFRRCRGVPRSELSIAANAHLLLLGFTLLAAIGATYFVALFTQRMTSNRPPPPEKLAGISSAPFVPTLDDVVNLTIFYPCSPPRPPPPLAHRATLDDLRRASPGLAAAFAPGPTSYQMFDCSRSELLSLHTSRASIARIGDGATPETQKPTNIPQSEDGALLGRLLDYHSYSDATVCDFDPALTITCQTSKGTYRFSVCFACSDVLIRLPSGKRRKVHMVPELRRAILRVARGIYPDDSVLKPLYRKYRV